MSALDIVLSTIQDEFSDISQIDQATRITLRLLLAVLLGGLLGFEREKNGKAAGVRTHMLVAVGSALFVMLPEQAGAGSDALSRVVQGIIAGVGFLCAGTILKSESSAQVQGLTTAAGIWLTAAIGITVGLGREAAAMLATLFGLLVLNVVPHLIERFENPKRP